ncbi:MAG: toll/interleukin-1 receptor domain-containing protein [Muribaculaceae bacterium]|nr:toll/interleukin-1 receptor domain-containing protein [Muribaculaceae bacterium]
MSYSIYAFISYSRKDKKTAAWLHHKIESFRYPADIIQDAVKPPHKHFVRPVFLDTKDLKVEERPFDDSIKDQLRRSRYLVVICSRNSAISPYVNMEINYFLESHNYNYSLVVPIFIDEVEGSIPEAFEGTSIMSRHFPIYNSMLGEKSEANQYCFLQLVAYMLDINFADVYNRYEQQSESERKKKIRKYTYATALAIVGLLCAIGLVVKQQQIIAKDKMIISRDRELIKFERDVFPAAVVFGYEANFLRPVISHLKEHGKDDFKICIFLPRTESELHRHQDRAVDAALTLKRQLGIDSLAHVNLPTKMRRGSRVLYISDKGTVNENLILDFATTTSSFLEVAKHKKEKHRAYWKTPINEMIEEYSLAFAAKTKEQLESDSVYVEFFMSPAEFVDYYTAAKTE